MQAVILAGGNPTRLYPRTSGVPKPLLPLFDRPLVEHQIILLSRHGIKDIIVAISRDLIDLAEYLGDGSRWGVKIRYSVEDRPAGSAGALKLVGDMIDEACVVLSSDAITDADLAAAVRFHRLATAFVTILISEATDPSDFGIVRCADDGRVTGFLEKPRSADIFSNTVSAGIYVIEPDVLSSIPHQTEHEIGLHLIPRLLNNGDRIMVFPISGYWCDAGSLNDYRSAHFAAVEGRLQLELPDHVNSDGVLIGENVSIHPSAVVVPPVFAGEGTVIGRNATVGPRAVLGAGAVVEEGAVVSRSVVGAGSVVRRGAKVSDCITGQNQTIAPEETVSNLMIVQRDQWKVPAGRSFAPSRPGGRLPAHEAQIERQDGLRRPSA